MLRRSTKLGFHKKKKQSLQFIIILFEEPLKNYSLFFFFVFELKLFVLHFPSFHVTTTTRSTVLYYYYTTIF
ncbi:hypothetical protein Glove_137g131 [Diversispora epigaea]|uniref:Uncharacterized protein n=1 Tax=Diversispora epigaea TaxID=1348612 RepID=A0A397IWC8_9GLOM|nr:hypothetical protein Glove_137g131 [Diversispora epigaea]